MPAGKFCSNIGFVEPRRRWSLRQAMDCEIETIPHRTQLCCMYIIRLVLLPLALKSNNWFQMSPVAKRSTFAWDSARCRYFLDIAKPSRFSLPGAQVGSANWVLWRSGAGVAPIISDGAIVQRGAKVGEWPENLEHQGFKSDGPSLGVKLASTSRCRCSVLPNGRKASCIRQLSTSGIISPGLHFWKHVSRALMNVNFQAVCLPRLLDNTNSTRGAEKPFLSRSADK